MQNTGKGDFHFTIAIRNVNRPFSGIANDSASQAFQKQEMKITSHTNSKNGINEDMKDIYVPLGGGSSIVGGQILSVSYIEIYMVSFQI